MPKTTLSDYFDCQIIDGSLFYKTQAEDGTPTLRPLNRPKDLDKGLLRDLRNVMTPEERRTLTASDILRILRDGARIADPLPEPWAVGPDPSCIEALAVMECGFGRSGDAPRIPKALASGILARHRDPSARVAPLIIIATPSEAPKVLALASVLASGRVHEHGPGHGEASPGTLVEVWRTPPADYSRLALAIRGDSRTARPVPVILCDPGQWEAWEAFFGSHSRRANSMPAHHAYVTQTVTVPTKAQARDLWAGLLAWATSDRLRAVTCPRRSSGEALGRLADALAVSMAPDPVPAPTEPEPEPSEAPTLPHGPPVE